MSKKKASSYIVDVLANCSSDSRENPTAQVSLLPAAQDGGTPQVVPISLSCVDALSSIRVYVPKVCVANHSFAWSYPLPSPSPSPPW